MLKGSNEEATPRVKAVFGLPGSTDGPAGLESAYAQERGVRVCPTVSA